jgi:hypothetical protein
VCLRSTEESPQLDAFFCGLSLPFLSIAAAALLRISPKGGGRSPYLLLPQEGE